ncbi:MAG: phosphoglycerate dehydrogenase [Planctomycetota bacterium]|nr:phosphoglycerate dehydrogenase [Planctomycetota bacterium]
MANTTTLDRTPTVNPTPSRTMVVLVADKLAPECVTILEEAGIEVRVQQGLTPDELKTAAADVDGILVRSASKIPENLIAEAPLLKAVGRAGIGVDNIDVAAASRHGVLVMNTPTANAITTGELAIAHLFALARHIPEADASMREGRWDKGALVGSEVTGKVFLVIGLGKIGRVVAERAVGLGMKVLAHDPFIQGPCPVKGAELASWEEGLGAADFISVHVPKNKDTLGLLDKNAFALMKSGARLINCARGGIVVEEDLIAALGDGTLAGAALDVYETEPLPEESNLRGVPNLHLTPHLGASSDEAQQRVSVEIAEQMRDYLLQGEARNGLNAPSLSAEALTALRPYLSLARRCGLFLAQTANEAVDRLEISYGGELGESDTEPLRIAVIAGLLAPTLDGPVNAVNAPLLATERGWKILEEHPPAKEGIPNLLRVVATTTSGATFRVAGTVFQGQPRLVRFGGFGVDFIPEGNLLLTRHRDEPGVLGTVATLLGEWGVNIGGLHMGQVEDGGTEELALALYQISRPLSAEEENHLAALGALVMARSISMEG